MGGVTFFRWHPAKCNNGFASTLPFRHHPATTMFPLKIKQFIKTISAVLTFAFAGSAVAKDSKTLDVYWVDVEGGGGTLIVTPAGESILIDTGMPGGRDPRRLHDAATQIAGVKQIDQPFGFLREAHAVPVTVTEFGMAAGAYPVIFVGDERVSVAVMGVRQGQNLFVKPDGMVEQDFYVPAFVRRYPFVFAADNNSDRLLLCVDREAPMVSDQPEIAFFENGQPSDFTQNAMQFCQEFERQRRQTAEFVKDIDKLGLFAERTASFQPRDQKGNNVGEPQVLAKYWAIDEEKVKQLPDEKLCEMQRNGMLGACTAHSISLLNWSRVINRAMRQQSSDAVQQPQGGSDGPSLQI